MAFQSVIQAVTEFLPISSSGHLWVVKYFWGIVSPGLLIEITLHLASVCAVGYYFWVYRHTYGSYFKNFRFLTLLMCSTATTCVLGWFLSSYVVGLKNIQILSFNYLVMACLLLASLWIKRIHPIRKSLDQLTVASALFVGLVQGVAIFPGISRSGIAIIAMLLLGFSGEAAFLYAFSIAVPTILAASGYVLFSEFSSISMVELPILGSGFLVTLLLSYPVLIWVRRWVMMDRLYLFSIYCFCMAFFLWSSRYFFHGG